MSVFISYSRSDSEFVDLLQRLLVSKGYNVWIDRRNIEAGSRWDESVEEALRGSSHVLVVISPEAASSQNVTDEWSFALEEGKTVIPLYYRQCSIPMRLRRLQWLDFQQQPFAAAFRSLTDALGEPENRPLDPIELARREGLVYVDTGGLKGLDRVIVEDADRIRIALVYSEYPRVVSFLQVVWLTLMSRIVEGHTYGIEWVLRDKVTGQEYFPPEDRDATRLLLHEVGIEPGAQLEVIRVGK